MAHHPPLVQPDFSVEFLRHHRALWLVALSVVANTADADDVVQEAAIIALRKFDTFAAGTSFRAWMGEIVRNVARNRRRQVHREIRRFGQPADAHAIDLPGLVTARSPIDALGTLRAMQEAFDDRVLASLLDLDDTARACVLLRLVEGLDYGQISQILSIPEGTAMSHVFRSRRVLAAALTGSSLT